MEEHRGTSLTRREFDAVIRRAAELATSDPADDGALTEVELYRIAGDVGLDEAHVRRALVEVRSGESDVGLVDRVFGRRLVRAIRVVPGTPAELTKTLDAFLVGNQLLQSVRRGPAVLQYRPSIDWASTLARAASFHVRKYYIASATSVDVYLEEVEEGSTRLEVVVDPGTRSETMVTAAMVGGGGGALGGTLAGVGIAALGPVALGIAGGLAVGAGIASTISWAVGRAHKKTLSAVQTELEGVLDSLEMGESLEPPPSSWRRWVKRNFHGVARDLMGKKDLDDVGSSEP